MAMAAVRKAPSIVKAWGEPRWATFLKYGKVELTPPSLSEIPEALGQAASLVKSATTFKWTKVPVKEAWINTLVTAEVVCWFFVGECIGKRSLIGYNV